MLQIIFHVEKLWWVDRNDQSNNPIFVY